MIWNNMYVEITQAWNFLLSVHYYKALNDLNYSGTTVYSVEN